MFMGKESMSRRKSQEAINRRYSNIRRQDSKGRVYVRTYDGSQSQKCSGRSQSRDCWEIQDLCSNSISRLENYKWSQSENRNQYEKSPTCGNKHRKFKKYIGYACSNCKDMRDNIKNRYDRISSLSFCNESTCQSFFL